MFDRHNIDTFAEKFKNYSNFLRDSIFPRYSKNLYCKFSRTIRPFLQCKDKTLFPNHQIIW